MNSLAPVGFRLSPQQRQLWSQTDAASHASGQVQAILKFAVEMTDLEPAVHELMARYEILRTNIECVAGTREPAQIVRAFKKSELPKHDLSCQSIQEQRERLTELLRGARDQEFLLDSGELVKFQLARLQCEKTALLLTVSAFCADIQSIHNIAAELNLILEQQAGVNRTLDEPLQFADLAEWQNELLNDEEDRSGAEFWSSQRSSYGKILKLPSCDRETVDRQTPLTGIYRFTLPAVDRLPDAANGDKATIDVRLLSVWFALLYKLSGDSEIRTAVKFDGRSYQELQPAVGLFERFLPMACAIREDSSYSEILDSVSDQYRQMAEYQEYFQLALDVDSSSTVAEIATCFEWREAFATSMQGARDCSVTEEYSLSYPTSLKLACVNYGDAIKCEVYFDQSKYSAEFVSLLADRFTMASEQLAAQRNRAISEIPIMGQNERQRIVNDFNDTDFTVDPHQLIHHLFEACDSNDQGKDIAIMSYDSQITYAALNQRANQLANYLKSKMVGPGTMVLLCIDRSIEMLVGILGILKAGAAYVPVDPTYPAQRIDFIVEDTQAPVVITQNSLGATFSNSNSTIVCLDSDWITIADFSADKPRDVAMPGDAAYVIYTSGSTGNPKGVLVTHSNIVNSTAARISYYGGASAVFLLLSSFAFDSSIAGIFGTLSRGATLVLPKVGQERDASEIAKLIETYQVNQLLALPSLYSVLLSIARPAQLSTLLSVIVAGEACPADLVRKHFDFVPEVQLHNEYGPTEGSVWSTVYQCQKDDGSYLIPIGKPVGNVKLYILDSAMRPSPIGVTGEIYLGGAGVAKGYLNRDVLTQERFVSDPFDSRSNNRLYRTGDRARHLITGDVEFLGRVDNQVKIHGHRIELEEIEMALSSHPGVEDAVVVAWDAGEELNSLNGKSDSPTDGFNFEGKGTDLRLIAYTVAPGNEVSGKDFREFLMNRLPGYMIPANFVTLEKMPLNNNGKKDRAALPDPRDAIAPSHDHFVPPRTSVEKLIAGMWASTLRAEKIGLKDDFFELGGHSIIATLLIARLREALQIEIPIRYIFESPTIEEFSARLLSDPAKRDRVESAAEIMAKLSDMSDEQIAVGLQQNND